MTDFVLEQKKVLITYKNHDKGALFERCENYANFLKKPLELWMFVPCSVDGDVIPEPYNDEQHVIIQHLEYAEAKEKILFVWQDGFDYKGICEMFIDLEDIIDFDFELTQTAIKQLGL